MAIILNGDTGITDVNGTAAAPAITGTDTDTGLYFGTNTLGLSTAGTNGLYMDSSRNVGIGTTSPESILHVQATTPIITINGTGDNVARGINYQLNGTTYASTTLNTNTGEFALSAGQNGSGFYTTFKTGNGTERMRIDTSGNVLVGKTASSTTTSGVQFSSGGLAAFTFDTTGDGPLTQFVAPNASTPNGFRFTSFRWGASATEIGTITKSGASTTAYNTSSDYRLKENIMPMIGALEKIKQLNPVTYTWKEDGSDGQGFIAHELQAIVPDCVTGEKDAVDEEGNPKYQGVDTSFLVATLTKAIQELKEIVDAQQQRIETLEGK